VCSSGSFLRSPQLPLVDPSVTGTVDRGIGGRV